MVATEVSGLTLLTVLEREELQKEREKWLGEARVEPTEGQWPILRCNKQFVLVAGGEQSGKSVTAAGYLTMRWRARGGKGLYWLVAADYGRTRREFEYLVENFGQLGVLDVGKTSTRVDPGQIVLKTGMRVETKSAKDVATIAMYAPDGIIACEASQLELEAYYRLRARATAGNGWMFMSGTFESSLGWYPKLYEAWAYGTKQGQSFSLPSWTNKFLYPGGRADPKIKAMEGEFPDAFFMERIAGRPCPPKGIVFWEFRPDLHVREDMEWLPDVAVHLWVDPGYAGAAAVEAVQMVDGRVRVFDEIYERNLVTEDIIDIAMKKEWWRGVKFVVGDVAARQHQAMPAVNEVWQARTGLYMSGEKVGIREGIDRMKGYLKPDPIYGQPGLVISPKCRGLISELGGAPDPFDGQTRVFRYKTDREGNVVGDEPEDRNNHGIKAIIYGLVGNFGYVKIASGRGNVKDWRAERRMSIAGARGWGGTLSERRGRTGLIEGIRRQ